MAPVAEFEARRGMLFGLAYRMLGSAAEAEDVVQDTYLRWADAVRADIVRPDAWLAKVATNLCLNRLTSARAVRERYVGPWLPEPVRTDDLGPLETVAQRDSVSFAVLVLLERLSPAERAVFVLREAFGYTHGEIATVMDLSEANTRQLYRRAAGHLADRRRRFEPDRATRESLTRSFLTAATTGDLAGLEKLLARDVTSQADSGGHAATARRPVTGRAEVARYLAGSWRKVPGAVRFEVVDVNGGTGVLAYVDDTLYGAVALEFDDDRIAAIRVVANPAKLSHLGAPVGS